MADIVIIGAGQAGQACASRLRAKGFDGGITLIGEELVPPYQRPPLSKKYLLGEMELERLFLRPLSHYDEQGIDLILNAEVDEIDPRTKLVKFADDVLPYDHLVLTTGSDPRRLPASIGGDLDNVFTVRTLGDVDEMEPLFRPGKRLLVVGGGYIGLEAAAVAARKGIKVVLVEMADRILQRVAAPQTSDYFRAAHQAEGVEIRESTGLKRLTGTGAVDGAEFSDGTTQAFDLVIVGVGIVPTTDLAASAGLTIDNGIAVDAHCRSSDPSIWAAGDCASFPHGDGRLRLESVGNAIDMAECLADNLAGEARAYVPKPWFWSDQYDIHLQIAGLSTGYDRVVTRGVPDGASAAAVSFWYYAGDRLLAVDALNDARAYMVGKRLIEAGKSPDPALVADTDTDLKALLKA